jgi:hypothetical protein
MESIIRSPICRTKSLVTKRTSVPSTSPLTVFIEGMTDDIALVKHLIMGTGGVWTTPGFYRIFTLHTYFILDQDK